MGGGGETSRMQDSLGAAAEMEALPQLHEPLKGTSSLKAVPGFSRPIGQTEEGWMKAFECGTGHTVLGVLMRRHLERDILQRAVDSVLSSQPRARSILIQPSHHHGQHETRELQHKTCSEENAAIQFDQKEVVFITENLKKGKPVFLVPDVGDVRVRVESGWQPRDSMEQMDLEQQSRDNGSGTQDIAPQLFRDERLPSSDDAGGGSIREDTCFEIGRRWEPEDQAAEESSSKSCSCGCGCGTGGTSGPDGATGIPEAAQQQERQGVNKAKPRKRDAGQKQGAETQTGDATRCVGKCSCGVTTGRYKLSMCQDKWLQIVEAAMNAPWEGEEDEEEDEHDEFFDASSEGGWDEEADQQQEGSSKTRRNASWIDELPGKKTRLFHVILHRLPPSHSLVLMKVHTMACDRVSAALLMEEILEALSRQVAPAEGRRVNQGENEAVRARRLNPKCVEDCISRKLSGKPFWAHGVDVVGYGLGSRRHACLPFRNPHEERRSQLIRSGLSRPDTEKLIKACEREKTSMHGVLSAAVLLAAAKGKSLGSKAEHFGITTLLDLRPMLPAELHPRTMGFYHSAMMNTHHVSEQSELWDLARKCHDSVAHSVSKRKQFTDMGDLLMLMGQAMQHPNLTPHGSLRTSLLSIFRDPLFEKMERYISILDVEDSIGCSSVHGVGPCLAVFDSIREDGLHMANVYPAPLFSRSQMRRLVIHTMELLHAAIAKE